MVRLDLFISGIRDGIVLDDVSFELFTHDKKGRLVNRRGYLIDQIGNVINKLGKVFFFVDELNPEDDEIPEPFCFDRLKSLKSKN